MVDPEIDDEEHFKTLALRLHQACEGIIRAIDPSLDSVDIVLGEDTLYTKARSWTAAAAHYLEAKHNLEKYDTESSWGANEKNDMRHLPVMALKNLQSDLENITNDIMLSSGDPYLVPASKRPLLAKLIYETGLSMSDLGIVLPQDFLSIMKGHGREL